MFSAPLFRSKEASATAPDAVDSCSRTTRRTSRGLAATVLAASALGLIGHGATAADVEYVPSKGSPGWLSIDSSTVQFPVDELDPCLRPMALGITPQVDLDTLREMTQEEPGYGSDYTFTVEAAMTIQDERGAALATKSLGFTVDNASEAPEGESSLPGRITLGWDGLIDVDGRPLVAEPGRYDLVVKLSLNQVYVEEPEVIAERALDSGLLTTRFEVRSALEACRAWEKAAPRLAEGAGGVVVMNGNATHTAPWARWRRGVPQTVFGNLGRRSGSNSRLDTVRDYLVDFSDLYALSDPLVARSLELRGETPQVDGGHLLILQQTLDDGGIRRRLYGGQLTAQFDASDRFVFLTGVLAPRLPGRLASESLSESDAVDVVTTDFANRGLHTNRQIGVLERVAYESSPGFFEPAYLVGVDSNIATEESFHYVVSANSGNVLRRKSLRSLALASIPILKWDPDLIEDNRGSLIVGDPDPIPWPGVLRIDSGRPHRLEDTINSGPGSVGVISETFFDAANGVTYEPEWNDLIINRFPDATSPRGHSVSASLAQYRAAFVALDQIQEFWDRRASPWTLFVSRLDLHFLRSIPSGAAAVYDERTWADDEIHFPRTYDPTSRGSLYTPTHEVFHHFDNLNVDLETGCTIPQALSGGCPSDDHRMPFALKEGLAEFNIDLMDGLGVNNTISKVRSLTCVFRSNRRECFRRWFRNFRKNATDIQRPTSMSGIVSQWPDCRTDTGFLCFQVGVDGAANDLPFPGQSPNDTMTQEFVPQLLLDLWETGASTIAGSLSEVDGVAFADRYGDFVMRAYLALCDDASLPDLRDALKFSALETLPSMASRIDLVIEDVFSRHGIDASLDAFCADNESQCH